MCGIFGYVGHEESASLESHAKLMKHRGPDGFASLSDESSKIYLAHCRLSIIDLSDRGRQPMSNENDDVWVVFNGEIYNYQKLRAELISLGHRFKSSTDTEVIVHGYEQWGESFVERLQGMFAIAIWDKNGGKLLLIRDRVGIKPLYWFQNGDEFGFASEIKSLTQLADVGDQVSQIGLASFLGYGYTTGEQSIWEQIHRLRPGHLLTLNLLTREFRLRCYWKLPEANRGNECADAEERVEELLGDAVASHLVSDVPVSMFLSGGLDSSLIAALAAKNCSSFSATTVEFDGWDRNEGDLAAEICRSLMIPHNRAHVSRSSFANPAGILQLLDEPLADTAVFSTHAVCEKTREHAKVALSGDGGDELFGGYSWYRALISTPRRQLAFLIEKIRRMLGFGRRWPDGMSNWQEYHQFLTSPGFSPTESRELMPMLRGDAFDVIRDRFSAGVKVTGFRGWQSQDFHTYLVDNNLTRMDRISMSHSLEVRVPFLDHRVVELACQLPDSHLINKVEQKVVLRSIGKKKLPDSIMKAPKRGFSCPVESLWPTDLMVTLVRNGSMQRRGWLARKPLNRFLDSPRRGSWWYRLWLLAVLEVWAAKWGMT